MKAPIDDPVPNGSCALDRRLERTQSKVQTYFILASQLTYNHALLIEAWVVQQELI